MEIRICRNPEELGKSAAKYVANVLNKCIKKNGKARIVLSTGASQFDTLTALTEEGVDWGCVEMFHLDEYIGIDETHKASFRKYLNDRFISKVNIKKAFLIDGTKENLLMVSEEIRKEPIDIGLIGIGENAHIAFNDPPADFNVQDPYIILDLNEDCKKQQVGEGWFETVDCVPNQAVSMSVSQILKCERIVSCVPYKVKAKAVTDTLNHTVSNTIPATIMKDHGNYVLYLDMDSASQIAVKEIV